MTHRFKEVQGRHSSGGVCSLCPRALVSELVRRVKCILSYAQEGTGLGALKPVGTRPERAEERVQEAQAGKCESVSFLGEVWREKPSAEGGVMYLGSERAAAEASWLIRCLGRVLCGSVHPLLQYLGG